MNQRDKRKCPLSESEISRSEIVSRQVKLEATNSSRYFIDKNQAVAKNEYFQKRPRKKNEHDNHVHKEFTNQSTGTMLPPLPIKIQIQIKLTKPLLRLGQVVARLLYTPQFTTQGFVPTFEGDKNPFSPHNYHFAWRTSLKFQLRRTNILPLNFLF